MTNTKKQSGMISRRTVLRGASASLGLPLLEAMTPYAKSAFAAEATSRPVRMAFVFVPNGVIVPDWKPTGDERNWQLSKTLKSIAPIKSKVNVVEGLAHDNGRSHKDGAGDHARCAAPFLTAARPLKSSSNIQLGISVDQVAANALASETALPSIELGLEPSRNAGSCDSGYSCAYSSNISWRNETTPMPKETTPRAVFDRMFGRGEAGERRKRNLVRKSILDVVRRDAEKIMGRVGKSDKRKLDEYFTSVREIERRIARVETEDQAALPDIEIPFGRVESFRERARLMFDMMAVGFQTDTTRIATFMLDNAGGNRRYTEVGVKDAHHSMSHHRNKKDTVSKIQKVDEYLVEQYAYFLQKLDSISDGDGTLLDQSMVLYGSGLSDGNRHRHDDLPILLAGNAGGKIETNRLIKLKDETPMGNLFLSMLDVIGTPIDSIGDSKGRLTQL